MNNLLIIVGIIFLACVLIGVYRGLLKIVASLAVTIATIVLVLFLSPYVSRGIIEYTPLEKDVEKYCATVMRVEDKEAEEPSREEQIRTIEGANLPKVLQNLLLDNNNNEIYTSIGVENFQEYIYKFLAKKIADILAFVITFLVFTIVARVAIYIFGIIGDLPVIGGVNRLAGGALGLATGLVIVWVMFAVVTLLYQTSFGVSCMQNITDSQILTFLYENNLLMKWIL